MRGVDTYARLLKHEFTHKRCYEEILAGAVDSDQDRVPDVWEKAVGLSVDNPDTMGFTFVWGGYPPKQGDSEVFARLYEEGVPAPMSSDWADSGLQKVGPAPNVCKRTIVRDRQDNVVDSLADLGGAQPSNLP